MTAHLSRRCKLWLTGVLLMVALGAGLIGNNVDYYFHANLYESGDAAVNSFQIERAKSFHELYGQYSRWEFHHPGPAFFYVQAWGEQLFHDRWHLAPQPLNAQLLAVLLLNVGFIAAALATANDQVGPRTLFLPLALGLGSLHTAAIGAQMILGHWPPQVMVPAFGVLLVAGATVAAGRGGSLPLMVLAGGFLAHGHVAQAALFVLPVSCLAYGGLVAACRRAERLAAGVGGEERRGRWWARAGRAAGAPWRAFPWAHLCAGGLLAVFLLPLAVDLCRGRESNAAALLTHLRAHTGEHKKWIRSVWYFVQFGLCATYEPGAFEFGAYSAAGVQAYLREHRFLCELWLLAILGALARMAAWRRVRPVAAAAAAPMDGEDAVRVRRRFIAWLWVFLAATLVLTLAWGHIMDGPMFYFNAYFNHAICYVAMLGAAAAAVDWLEATGATTTWRSQAGVYAACLALSAANADLLRLDDDRDRRQSPIMARTVDAAMREEPEMSHRCYLDAAPDDWEVMVGVALRLKRAGWDYRMPAAKAPVFGREHAPAHPLDGLAPDKAGFPMRVWKIEPAGARNRPLMVDLGLNTERPLIDPNSPDGDTIRFGGTDDNASAFIFAGGWSPSGTGDPCFSRVAREGWLNFRARPVPTGSEVRVKFSLAAASFRGGRRETVRLCVGYNGQALGAWPCAADAPLEIVIPAEAWNAAPAGWMEVSLPGVPESGRPDRVGGLIFERITFQAVEATPAGR